MSYMIEVYYKPPADAQKEKLIAEVLSPLGGRITFREHPAQGESGSCCLTVEFDVLSGAESAAEVLRERGEHVEGPCDYGPESTSTALVSGKMSPTKRRSKLVKTVKAIAASPVTKRK